MHWNQSSLVLFGCELVETRPFFVDMQDETTLCSLESMTGVSSHRIALHRVSLTIRSEPPKTFSNKPPTERIHA